MRTRGCEDVVCALQVNLLAILGLGLDVEGAVRSLGDRHGGEAGV